MRWPPVLHSSNNSPVFIVAAAERCYESPAPGKNEAESTEEGAIVRGVERMKSMNSRGGSTGTASR